MISKKEKEALESSFQLLDKNCDGQISKVELCEFFKRQNIYSDFQIKLFV
jgi:Ca2+-binding EF-hand superfamily protein